MSVYSGMQYPSQPLRYEPYSAAKPMSNNPSVHRMTDTVLPPSTNIIIDTIRPGLPYQSNTTSKSSSSTLVDLLHQKRSSPQAENGSTSAASQVKSYASSRKPKKSVKPTAVESHSFEVRITYEIGIALTSVLVARSTCRTLSRQC